MKRLVRSLCIVVASVATFALYNYPRSWWQELLCVTALAWAPLFAVGAIVELKRMARRGTSLVSLVLLVLSVMCVFKVCAVVRPYVYSPAKSYPTLEYSRAIRIAFIDAQKRDSALSPSMVDSLKTEEPDVIVTTDFAESAPLALLADRYPYRLVSSVSSPRRVEVASKTPISPPARTEYGYGALPGVLGALETPDGFRFQLGAMDLEVSSSQRAFNESRLTSRRLASALKYSDEPRIVVGAFRASVTSQLVDMYVDQLKLRSIFFNSGLARVGRSLVDSLRLSPNMNVFTSRTIQVLNSREAGSEESGYSALLFSVRVPRQPTASLGIGR